MAWYIDYKRACTCMDPTERQQQVPIAQASEASKGASHVLFGRGLLQCLHGFNPTFLKCDHVYACYIAWEHLNKTLTVSPSAWGGRHFMYVTLVKQACVYVPTTQDTTYTNCMHGM